MTNERDLYRTLFYGDLVQRTAMSVGGRESIRLVDDGFALDGSKRPVLRGTGLAGALIASARDLFGENGIAACISYGAMNPEDFYRDSAWITHNAHLPAADSIAWHYRTAVGISQSTGAAAEGVLFDTETAPAGTRWNFCLEVDHDMDDGKASALATACFVLREWQQNGCLLGRDVARGMGWLQLESLKVLQLAKADMQDWPDASEETRETLVRLFAAQNGRVKNLEDVINGLSARAPRPTARSGLLRGTIRVRAGKYEWGLDSLSLGGHDMNRSLQKLDTHCLKPLGQKKEAYDNRLAESDLTFSWMKKSDRDTPEPFIPGSSLRGTMRHAFSWIERRGGKEIWDPNDPKKKAPENADEKIAAWFGTPEESAQFLISDALAEKNDWRFVLLEQHAEDEFTQGVYADAKFDRLTLIEGTFKAEFFFRGRLKQDQKDFIEAVNRFGKLAQHGLVPLGGNAFRGHGALRWTLELRSRADDESREQEASG